MAEGTLVIDSARSLNAVSYALVQMLQTPLGEGNANYRDLEGVVFHHRIERREDHFVGQIARYTEDFESI